MLPHDPTPSLRTSAVSWLQTPSNPTSLGTSSPCSLCPQLHPQSGRTSTSQLLGIANCFLLEDCELDDEAKLAGVGPEDEVRPWVCTLAVGAPTGSRRGVWVPEGYRSSSAALLSTSLRRQVCLPWVKLVFTKVHSDDLACSTGKPGESAPLETSWWITHATELANPGARLCTHTHTHTGADADGRKTCTAHCFRLEPGGTEKVEIQLATLRQEPLHRCVFVHTDVSL